MIRVRNFPGNTRKVAGLIYQRMRGIARSIDLVIVTPQQVRDHQDSPFSVRYPALREGRIVYERKKHSPDNPAEWIARAKSSFALATAGTPGVLYEDLCFQAQQAAEKALKAVFVSKKIPYQYTHDINALLSGLELQGIEIPCSGEIHFS